MERDCTDIQEDLTEVGGRLEELARADREHLALCSACSEVAAGEASLHQVLERAMPPADEELQQTILSTVARARLKRRLLAMLPVACSLLLALSGLALLGSLPGAGLIGQLPRWSSSGWVALAANLQDWQLALTAAATSAANAMSPITLILAALLGLGGLVAAVALARMDRPSWHRQKS